MKTITTRQVSYITPKELNPGMILAEGIVSSVHQDEVWGHGHRVHAARPRHTPRRGYVLRSTVSLGATRPRSTSRPATKDLELSVAYGAELG